MTTPDPTPSKSAAKLLREIAARDPEGHKRALAAGYGVDRPMTTPDCIWRRDDRCSRPSHQGPNLPCWSCPARRQSQPDQE